MPRRRHPAGADQGFALVGLVVAIFIILLFLAVAAPIVAKSLRREREVEAVHRANQYVRAIQLYYRKFGHYPASLDQLEKSNNIRFLRHKYVDPMTGKADWRLIKVGENKTSVKGFFGQPLAGVGGGGLGAASGMVSGTGSSPGGLTSSFGGGSLGGSAPESDSSATGMTGAAGSSTGLGGSSLGGSSLGGGLGSSASGGLAGAAGPFLGVGLPVAGDSILTVNEKTAYPEWEFLYDPRIEQLRAKVNLFGGGMAATSASSLGSAGGLASPTSGGTTSSPPGLSPGGSMGTGTTSPTGSPTSPGSSSPQ